MDTRAESGLTRAVLVGIALLCAWIALRGLVRSLPGDGLWDFGSFVASGRAAAEGLNPYGIHPLTFHVVLPGFESWNPNLNPPISALLFQAFDLTDPHTAFRIWWAISAVCYAATIALLLRHYAPPYPWLVAAWMLALAGFWDTLVLGQIYTPLVLAGVAGWLALEKGAWLKGGLLIGLVCAMKPNFLVWPALLFLSGRKPAALSAVATAGIVSAVPILLYGPAIYHQWLELVASDGARGAFLTNVSLFGILARAGVPELGPWVGLALLAALALWAFKASPDIRKASAVGIAGALLASPVAWIHYTLFLLPAFLVFGRSWGLRLAGALLVVPVPYVLDFLDTAPWVRATVGSLYGWATLICLLSILSAPPALEMPRGRRTAAARA